MNYAIRITPSAEKTIAKWKKSNPNLHKKLIQTIQDMALHPREGIGHPEPLKGGGSVTYSRRISAHDRIIYDIQDDVLIVLVIEVEGHYGDK